MSFRGIKRIYYKEASSSEADIAIEIDDLSKISPQTNKWSKEDCASLKISYENAKDIYEIVQPQSLEGHYKELQLNKWNPYDFRSIQNPPPSRKIQTILHKIRNVVIHEEAGSMKENKVDSFVMSFMEFLGFDEYPLMMHPQYDYSVIVGSNHKISSKVEYMITVNNTYVLLVIEDKHTNNVSELTDWSEPQIAGEIFGSAYHNVNIAGHHLHYPFFIYAIRIVSTKFTFYKAQITREYLEECSYGLPIRNSMIIKRYPPQEEASPERARTLNAWNFLQEEDRMMILSTLKGIQQASLN